MDLTDPQLVQALAVALVAMASPLVVWIARKVSPGLDLGEKWKKWTVSFLVTFIMAAAATPGSWREKLLAGAVAFLLTQGGYNSLRVVRSEQ